MSFLIEKCLLRVVKSFIGQFEDELSIEPGQIVQFISKIDNYWYQVFFENTIGKIPIDYCREIKSDMLDNLRIIPEMGQLVFVAKHDFLNQCEEGDLRFSRFEIIIGFHPINDEWWNGTRLNSVKRELTVTDSNCGIFPLTFVWKLRNDLLPEYIFDSKGIQIISIRNNIVNEDNKQSNNQSIDEEKNVQGTYLFYVKVIKTMDAKLDDEIDLPEMGEILGVISSDDKLYYQGESLTRKIRGIFPKNFVQKIETNPSIQISTSNMDDQSKNENFDNQDSDNSSIERSPLPPSFTPPLPIDYNCEKLYLNTISNDKIDQNILNYEDLPPSYEAAMSSQSHSVAFGYANYMFNEMEPYGRALYDFEAQDDSELSLRQNQIVRLIRYYDQEWMEGEINGKIGFFPRSYVSIIVDCKHTKGQFTQQETPWTNQNQINAIEFPPNSYAKVLYDFNGKMEQDLRIKAGDVITMLRRFTSTDWIEAQDASGNVGFVHFDFCQPFQMSSQETNESNIKASEEIENPKMLNEISEIPMNDSSQTVNTNLSKINLKPHRPAPLVPRRNSNLFPTFNQFLIQEKQDLYQFDLHETETVQDLNSNINGTGLKDRKRRECVIAELIQTEKDYCHSLNVCHQVFDSSSNEAKKCNVDVERLLSNMKNIINASKHLTKLLENYAENKAYNDQRVGICFINLKFEINESYTQYCRNHDSIHSLLKYYESDSMSHDYMRNCLGRIQDQANCFDLSSIWIKPVQRILKYPLLLNELIKFTEENHVDYEPLKNAFQMITDIATCINEHKRRQDLIQKYCRTKDSSLTEKLKNLSMHTVKKKSSRLRYRILSTLTFSSGTKDKDYEAALHTFQEIEKIIRTFIKDLKEYLDSLDKYHVQLMVAIESISEYCDLKKNPRFYIEDIRSKYRQMYQNSFKTFKESVDGNVLQTLNLLMSKFNGPLRLISKREDKRIDYETSLKSKNENTNITKNTFEALNQQLIDELPILSEASLQILSNCIEKFLYENKKLVGMIAKFQLDLHESPLINNTSFEFYQDIEETFRVKNNLNFEQMLLDFSLICASSFQDSSSTLTRLTRSRNSNTWKNSFPINKSHPPQQQQQQFENTQSQQIKNDSEKQTEFHRSILISKYGTQNLYVVNDNYKPCDVLEISVHQGDLIQVIKYKEPTGNENRWYVDRGFIQGFIPKNLLTPYRSPLYDTVHRYDSVSDDIHSYDKVPIEPQQDCLIPNEIEHRNNYSNLLSFDEVDSNTNKIELSEFDPLTSSKTESCADKCEWTSNNNSEENNYYTAAYPFKASGPNQLSLNFGQRVLVLKKHDTSGNSDWWFVTYSNQKGYVPGNYLKKY